MVKRKRARSLRRAFFVALLILQRQIIKNPTPTLTLPLKGRGFYGVFPLHGGDFIGFSHFHGSFSNSSPFKGEVRRGMGYICRCSNNYSEGKEQYALRSAKSTAPRRNPTVFSRMGVKRSTAGRSDRIYDSKIFRFSSLEQIQVGGSECHILHGSMF